MGANRASAEVAGERLAADVAYWEAAYEAWQASVGEREIALVRADRGVMAATGGLGVTRWRAACRRRRISTVDDARLRANALRARPAVERALAERDRALAEGDQSVLVARLALTEACKRLVFYGPLGSQLSGLGVVELRRLAKTPAKVSRSGQGAVETGEARL